MHMLRRFAAAALVRGFAVRARSGLRAVAASGALNPRGRSVLEKLMEANIQQSYIAGLQEHEQAADLESLPLRNVIPGAPVANHGERCSII